MVCPLLSFSGSRPEPFAVAQGSESSALSTPRVRLPPQRRVCRAPPQGRARQRRETREQGCHGQNPLGVGPCFTRALSRAATRNADHALPGVTARMGGSDFHASLPASSLLHLFAGARFPRTDARISLVTACSRCQARYGLGPRGAPVPLAMTRHGLLPAGGTNPSALPTVLFGAQHLKGRLHPLPLHLACASAEASTRLLPVTQQGSILGSRLTITQAGFTPARSRGLARPHCPRNSTTRFSAAAGRGPRSARIRAKRRAIPASACRRRRNGDEESRWCAGRRSPRPAHHRLHGRCFLCPPRDSSTPGSSNDRFRSRLASLARSNLIRWASVHWLLAVVELGPLSNRRCA